VRDLRHVRNLSQRQLAARMGVPRTYISKIENGKAMPTLSSLDRLARALQWISPPCSAMRPLVTATRLPFCSMILPAEVAKYTAHLTSTQKSIFLNHVRELSQSPQPPHGLIGRPALPYLLASHPSFVPGRVLRRLSASGRTL